VGATERQTANTQTSNCPKGVTQRKTTNDRAYLGATGDGAARQPFHLGAPRDAPNSFGSIPTNSRISPEGDILHAMKDRLHSDGNKMYSKGKPHRSHGKQHSCHPALPKTSSHHPMLTSQTDKMEKDKEVRDVHAIKDNVSPFGGSAMGRLVKDNIPQFGSLRGVMADPMLFNPSTNPFLAAGYFGQNFQSPYIPAAAGISYPQAAAAAAFGGILPFSFPDYFYPSASYLSALQEAYSAMRTGAVSSDKMSAAAARGGSANSVTSDKERPNGSGGGAGVSGVQNGVGGSTGMNGANSTQFDYLWAKVS